MRVFAPLLVASLLVLPPALAQDRPAGPNKLAHVPVTADPTTGAQYPKYESPADTNPTWKEGNIGPAQKPFVLASQPDDLANADTPPTVNNLPQDVTKLDKRITIKKVHEVETDANYPTGGNPALEFELKYINYGAITAEQYNARQGHYFTFTWCNKGPQDNFTAVFQYREVLTKDLVRTLTQPMPAAHDNVRAYFGVVGKAFQLYGPINAWRLTIRKGETVVAEEKSISW